MLWQLHAASTGFAMEKRELQEQIKLKQDAQLTCTNEQARLTLISSTLDKVSERIKEFEAKKKLIELQESKKARLTQ
jgi:hypothetical protein